MRAILNTPWGDPYTVYRCSMNLPWPDEPIIYTFARSFPTLIGFQVIPSYIGETESAETRMPSHEKWMEALSIGADEVFAMAAPRDLVERTMLEAALIRHHQPVLNKQHNLRNQLLMRVLRDKPPRRNALADLYAGALSSGPAYRGIGAVAPPGTRSGLL